VAELDTDVKIKTARSYEMNPKTRIQDEMDLYDIQWGYHRLDVSLETAFCEKVARVITDPLLLQG